MSFGQAMTASEKLKEISAFLESKGVEYAPKEAETIVTEALMISRSRLYTADEQISDEVSRHIDALAERRAAGEPLQYIIGHVDFYGLRIKVGPGVLIPRPETELLVEEVLRAMGNEPRVTDKDLEHHPEISSLATHRSSLRILDLCTGSGCIALALASKIPNSVVYGVDVSERALEYARENAQSNGVSNVTFLKGSLFRPVRDMKFDIIVSNPPYIKSADIKTLQTEIRDWEPTEALDGGEDGLAFYRQIISSARDLLLPGGFVALELGEGEAGAVADIAQSAGLTRLRTIRDFQGIERVLIAAS